MTRLYNRDDLGARVREIWIGWALQQPNSKLSWLTPYRLLSEPEQEVDRRIGEELHRVGMDHGVDFVFNTLAHALGLENWTPQEGSETWDGDVAATLYRLLYDAGVLDEDTNKLSNLTDDQTRA